MDLAIRVNVRYAAPPNSHIKDALRLFKSPRWVQSIIRYIMPQLNSVSPAATSMIQKLKANPVKTSTKDHQCVVCMDAVGDTCLELPCKHQFHSACIDPWLKLHSTCPTCRFQLPTDAQSSYSVYSINTTIILQQSQANMSTSELLELSASGQIIRAVVNARVRRSTPSLIATGASLSVQNMVFPPSLQAAPVVDDVSQNPSNTIDPLHSLVQLDDRFESVSENTRPILPASSMNRRRCRNHEIHRTTNNQVTKRARLSSSTNTTTQSITS